MIRKYQYYRITLEILKRLFNKKTMKYKIFCILLLVSMGQTIYGQTEEWTHKKLNLEFTTDTAYLENDIFNMLMEDSSTQGMIEASYKYEAEYDILLNKYYKILYSSLTAEGKKALKTSQLNWIKFRDSERALITEVNSKAYDDAGGGSVWAVFAANMRAELTKKRVIELYNYLMYGHIGE